MAGPKRPRDPNQLAKMMLDIATGEVEDTLSDQKKNPSKRVALHFMHYNFARIHKTLRVTPAMAAGVSDHVWSIEEIIEMIESLARKSGPRGPYKKARA